MRLLLPLVLVAMLGMTGCVANMADLKDKLDSASIEEPDLVESEDGFGNATPNLTAPVARVTIFGASNALLYKAPFAAADEKAALHVGRGVELTLLSGESEALHAGATLVNHSWSLAGERLFGTRVTAKLDEPGLYPLVLTVTDSNGRNDTQTVPLALAPDPFDVSTNLTTGPLVGAQGNGQAARLAFSLTDEPDGVKAVVQRVQVVARPALTCDVAVALLDAEGNSVKRADANDATAADQTERIDAGPLPVGGYAIEVAPSACIEPEGVPVEVIVTYLAIVPGVTDAGDGHGHGH